jgi:hypothetical protein
MRQKLIAPGAPGKPGTCGARPDLAQRVYNPMAPPCTFTPKHDGPHSWETDRWKITGG